MPEDTMSKWPTANQEESPHRKLTLPSLDLRFLTSRAMRGKKKSIVLAPSPQSLVLCYSTWADKDMQILRGESHCLLNPEGR